MIGLYILAGLSGIVLILLICLDIVLSRQKAAEKRAIDANSKADQEKAQIDAKLQESIAVKTVQVELKQRESIEQKAIDSGKRDDFNTQEF